MKHLWQRLGAWIVAHPLAAPLIVAVIVRLVAAIVGLGFHARDDYFHVLDPALRWFADPAFDWDATELPGAGIRSHLVPRIVWLMLHALDAVGISDPETVLRFIYAAFGCYSLLVVPGVYLASRRLLDDRGTMLATWLAAAHFAMPYAGTRLLIEAMAMPPLAFGLWLATYRDFGRTVGAGLMIGLACWFRFQVGIAAIGFAVAIALAGRADGGWREATRRVGALALGGATAVLVQGLFDVWTTGDFLGPVVRNIAVNLDPKPGLSRSTPFAYVGLWLLFTVPPATLVLLPMLTRAAKRLPLVAWPFLVFVLVHSAIPHKEDRFMLPVVPLFLILLAAAPAALESARGVWWDRLRRLWPLTRDFLVIMHLLALGLASTAQSQANLRDAMRSLRADPYVRGIVSIGPELQLYFLGNEHIPTRRTSKVDAIWLAHTLEELTDKGVLPNRFLAFSADRAKVEILIMAFGMRCEPPEEIDGWWLDRVIYALNPRRNKRRSPVVLWKCERPAVAMGH